MAKSISFSDQELEMLISNYQMELGEALDYVENIKALLKKLGASVKEQTVTPIEKKEKKTGAKRGRKAKAVIVAIEDKPKAKRSRKVKVVVPTPEPLASIKPVKAVTKSKPKVEKKPVAKQAAVPTPKLSPVAAKAKKVVVKPEPKPIKIAAKKVEKAVCNLASYPGVAQAAGAYEMQAAELQAHLAEHNPIDRLAALARNGVPLFAIHGDVDGTVPLEDNSGLVKRRYTALGGNMELIVPKGQGHNMWSGFFQCQELVNFVKIHATR